MQAALYRRLHPVVSELQSRWNSSFLEREDERMGIVGAIVSVTAETTNFSGGGIGPRTARAERCGQ